MHPLARLAIDLAIIIIIWCGVFEPWKHRGIRLWADFIAGVVMIAVWFSGLFYWLDYLATYLLGY
jgi:hypothetical protein